MTTARTRPTGVASARMPRRRPTIVFLAVALLAGCTATQVDWPTGPDVVVLRMQSFVQVVAPDAHAFHSVPSFSLYGDGRFIYDPDGEASGSGAFPPLVEGRLTGGGLREVRDLALASGLLDAHGVRYDYSNISDARTTVFTAVTTEDTPRHQAFVYALGTPGEPATETELERTGRRALTDFASQLRDLPTLLEASDVNVVGPFEPHAVHLFVEQFEPAAAGVLGRAILEWPGGDLATIGERGGAGEDCVVVSGQDLEAILPELRSAPEGAMWSSAGQTYLVSVDVLLPDEPEWLCQFLEAP